jgi:hypothetical protein
VNRLLLDCDQVFDVLTRGPFPSGSSEDAGVERHLAACHECRQLAEALAPAVECFHEAVSGQELATLPAYRGALARRGATSAKPDVRSPSADSRFLAASIAGLALGLLVAGTMLLPLSPFAIQDNRSSLVKGDHAAKSDHLPTADGLLKLASLRLPATCLPRSHRPLSPEQANQFALLLSDGSLASLRCCTDCHHATSRSPSSATHLIAANAMTAFQQSCQACHRS